MLKYKRRRRKAQLAPLSRSRVLDQSFPYSAAKTTAKDLSLTFALHHPLLNQVTYRRRPEPAPTPETSMAVIQQYLVPMLRYSASSRSLLSQSVHQPSSDLTEMLTHQVDAVRSQLSVQSAEAAKLLNETNKFKSKLHNLKKALVLAKATRNALRFMKPSETPTVKAHTIRSEEGAWLTLCRSRNVLNSALAEERSKRQSLQVAVMQCTHSSSLISMQNIIMGDQLHQLHRIIPVLRINCPELKPKMTAAINQALMQQEAQITALEMIDAINFSVKMISSKRIQDRKVLGSEIQHIKLASKLQLQELGKSIHRVDIDAQEKLQITECLSAKVTHLSESYDKMRYFMQALFPQKYAKTFMDEERTCSLCKCLYSENWNYSWSCSYHPSQWSGTMYWCCGKNTTDAEGCFRCKHMPEELESNSFALMKVTPKLFCSSCKAHGHTLRKCPLDPNVRSRASQQDELKRLKSNKQDHKLHTRRIRPQLQSLEHEEDSWDDILRLKPIQSVSSFMSWTESMDLRSDSFLNTFGSFSKSVFE